MNAVKTVMVVLTTPSASTFQDRTTVPVRMGTHRILTILVKVRKQTIITALSHMFGLM